MAIPTSALLLTVCLSAQRILTSPVSLDQNLDAIARDVFSSNDTDFSNDTFSSSNTEHLLPTSDTVSLDNSVTTNDTVSWWDSVFRNDTFSSDTISSNDTAFSDETSAEDLDLLAVAREVFSSDADTTTQQTASASKRVYYGVLLDVGSSSTKLKIYNYTKSSSSKSVPDVTLIKLDKPSRKFKPGLTDVEDGESGMKNYLAKIIRVAEEHIPTTDHPDTPIYVLATAGFRLLGIQNAKDRMQQVDEILRNETFHSFKYIPGSASVLSGEEEGAYAWVAANYLKGFFHENKPSNESVGVLEMGGGSTQIAFIPHDPLMAEEFQVIMAGKRYSLYVQSYLGFGLDAIKVRLENGLVDAHPGQSSVENPCMLHGDSKNFKFGNSTILLQGTGQPSVCRSLYDFMVASAGPKQCFLEPCAIGSVFQPSVRGIDFYAISAYVYALKAAHATRADTSLDLEILWDKVKDYCQQDFSQIPEKGRAYASANCMDAIYINELFTNPYGFPTSTHRIKLNGQINGVDIDWALGAMLEFLSLSFTGISSYVSVNRK